MGVLRIILVLVALAWCLPVHGQAEKEAERAFEVALKSFDGEFWARAEQEWRDFTVRFPLSPRLREAVLYQGQALVELGNYPGAVQLLQENFSQAGPLSDEYLFWIAEAHFRAGNNRAAAQTFERAVQEFPESGRALEAVLGQASARARLGQWNEVIAILQATEGPLMKAPPYLDNHLLLARGLLLMAEAQLAVGDYQAARATLVAPELDKLDDALEWQKQYLVARTLRAVGQWTEALAASSNLVESATRADRPNLIAEATLFQGGVLEEMGKVDQATATYRSNLSPAIPAAAQRQTLLRLSELLIANDRLSEARLAIEEFLAINPAPDTADLARLTIAELKLRQHLQSTGNGDPSGTLPTNLVEQAISDLDEVIQAANSRRLRGQAQFNRGWAEWMRGNFLESSTAFGQAATLLPRSPEQATARYKWADALFRLEQYDGARTNYEFVVELAPLVGGAALDLVEPALYQSLRAALDMDRPDLADGVLRRILTAYPDGFYASTSVLLTGQELDAAGDPAGARGMFEAFLQKSPKSPLAPEIRMAIARTHESEGNWGSAIDVYDAILSDPLNRPVSARADYFSALATAMQGDESRAFNQFTNFVVLHATNQLAPRAQWWIGDYHWRQEDYVNAELNYQLLFKNWPTSDLAYEARMMAGRAAMARLSPDAIGYFTNLTSDLKCPPDLKPKAMFAYGDALMRLKSTVTNDPLANYAEAIKVFSSVERNYPSNQLAAQAQGMMGNCYLVLAGSDPPEPRAYQAASNVYQRAIENPAATVAVRSQAEVGLATVLENQARTETGELREALLSQALDHLLNVFYEKNLGPDEEPDLFWVKQAGWEAGRLAELLQAWPQALKLYQRLEVMIPSLEPLLQNKILKASQRAAQART
jgi:TolA-binding protein